VLDLAILGLLSEGEFHGYEIRKRLRDELGLFANISFGSLYPALSRLETTGAVTATESAGAPVAPIPLTGSLGGERAALRARRTGSTRGTKRSRKVYRITDRGRALFVELLAADEPVGTDEARSFSLRLAFARHLAPQARLGLLERRREQLARRLTADRARAAGGDFDSYTRSLVEHSTETTEHELSWLDRLIESEKQKQTAASTTDHPGPHPVGTASTASKGTES
jgi:DNA-binding PadR family transcriptional regulator